METISINEIIAAGWCPVHRDEDMMVLFAWNGMTTFGVWREEKRGVYSEIDGWMTDVRPADVLEARERCKARARTMMDEEARADSPLTAGELKHWAALRATASLSGIAEALRQDVEACFGIPDDIRDGICESLEKISQELDGVSDPAPKG